MTIWKLITEYNCGYRVEDQAGNVVLSDMNSFHAVRLARDVASARGVSVKFEFYHDEGDHLEKVNPPSWYAE